MSVYKYPEGYIRRILRDTPAEARPRKELILSLGAMLVGPTSGHNAARLAESIVTDDEAASEVAHFLIEAGEKYLLLQNGNKKVSKTLIESYMHSGCRIEIHRDEDAMTPREGDNLVTLACWHTRYKLGDRSIQHCSKESLREDAEANGEGPIIAVLPLYLYDHSGITMNTTGFSCQFDSGQVGWAYVTVDAAEKMGCTNEDWRDPGGEWKKEKFLDSIRSEVETYDSYLKGEVYGYKVFKAGEEDSDDCWGYYSMSDVKDCAEAVAKQV